VSIPSLSGNTPLLVGRERELAVLHQNVDAAMGGHGGLVLIGGEAGIGKTALAETVCREATERGARVLVGHCYDLTETPPYGPWIELFGRYRQTDDLPSLPDAFARRGTVGPVASQAALFQQALDFFVALAARHPLVILLDDLHWADSASLDLLRVLARSLMQHPLLLLATYRVDELTRRHPLAQLLPLLVREASAARLTLHPLEREATTALVRARFALPDRDTERLVAYLDERAEGNPFFVGELLQTLEEAGLLRSRTGAWVLGELGNVPIPPLLRQVIDGRLARFDADARAALAAAAVIGQDVPLDLLVALTDADEETVGATIEQGIDGHMLATLPDGARVRFVHALIREALYDGIAPLRRRAMHRRVGEILIALPDPDPDAVAYHFRQAGDARAAEWLTCAGERAHRAFAWQIASDRYEQALALRQSNGGEPQAQGWLLYRLATVNKFVNAPRTITYLEEAMRLGVTARDEALVANARFSLGIRRTDVRQGLREMEAAVAALRALSADDRARMKAMEIIEGLDAEYAQGHLLAILATSGRFLRMFAQAERVFPDLLDQADTGEPIRPALAWVYRGLASAHAALGQPEQARRAFRRAREALIALGDYLETGLNALSELRYALLPYYADDVAECQRVAAEAERWYAQVFDHNHRLPPERGSLPLMFVDGRWSEARSVAGAVLAVGGTGAYMGNARSVLCRLAYAQGDVALTTTLIAAVLPDGPITDRETMRDAFRDDVMAVHRIAAAMATDAGDGAEASIWLEAHDRWLAWSGSVLGLADGQLSWARVHRATGASERAREHARRALTLATEPRQPLALLGAHRALGELDTEAGRFRDAETHLTAALSLATACAAPYERALTLLAQAELRVAQQRRDDATALLDEVRAILTPLGANPALARADALAAKLGATHTSAPAYPADLSAREVEVLRLIAAGRTNREIADALFLSPGTVNVHVTHILTKTNSTNRTEAALFARDHGLA
jgi:DNA-binding CsgD family transcriptional regulator